MRELTPFCLSKLKQWEGFREETYDDATGKTVLAGTPVRGKLTIGYGHTGPDVTPGRKITEAEGEVLLKRDLTRFLNGVETAVKVPLTDNQFGALVSFAYNVGLGGKKPGDGFLTSTLLKKLNAGDYAAVPGELAKWIKSGGKTNPGLVNRRAAEAGLWATGEFVASTAASPATAPIISKESITYAASMVGSMGSILSGTGPVQYAFAAVFVIAACVAGYLFIQNRRHT